MTLLGGQGTAGGLFQKGLESLAAGETLAALAYFEKSFKEDPSPECKSFLALMIASERGQVKEAVELCEQAVAEAPEAVRCHLNLGRVLVKAGRKAEAIEAVRRGLGLAGAGAPHAAEGEAFLNSLGTRRKPVLPFLPRRSFINKYLGIALSRLGLR
ncbi:MAG: tetratricopeptide repeat protein [Thermodesulfovibrionales bacterium]